VTLGYAEGIFLTFYLEQVMAALVVLGRRRHPQIPAIRIGLFASRAVSDFVPELYHEVAHHPALPRALGYQIGRDGPRIDATIRRRARNTTTAHLERLQTSTRLPSTAWASS
jgi:hypothetical protein